jgi:hypothetical protein
MTFKILVHYEGQIVSDYEFEDGDQSFIHAAKAFKYLGAPSVQAKNFEDGVILFDPSGFSDAKVEILGLYLEGSEETCVILNKAAEA